MNLNHKVVTPSILDSWAAEGGVPRAVSLRHEVRKHLNYSLACLHAKHKGIRPIVWFNVDRLSQGQGKPMPADPASVPPVNEHVKHATSLLSPDKTEHVGRMQIFFPGCKYTFKDNIAPQLGFVNNGECEGVDVI